MTQTRPPEVRNWRRGAGQAVRLAAAACVVFDIAFLGNTVYRAVFREGLEVDVMAPDIPALKAGLNRHPEAVRWGNVLIDMAARNGQVRSTVTLLQYGAAPGAALRAAVLGGQWPVAGFILSSGFRPDRSAISMALWAAFTRRQDGFVMQALAAGTNAGIKQFGEPAISAAAFAGDLPAVEMLRAHGAHVDARAADGHTPLMACIAGVVSANYGPQPTDQPGAALLLLKLGARVYARDHSGRTAVDYAADDPEMSRLLARYGTLPARQPSGGTASLGASRTRRPTSAPGSRP